MVETNVYHWVNITQKNIVTSDSNYNYFFLVVVTGPFLQCLATIHEYWAERMFTPLKERVLLKPLFNTKKVHNFTTINLPSELNELLNKGIQTNFIPNSNKINISTIKKPISWEANSALSQII